MREHTVAIGALPLDAGVVVADVAQRVTIYGKPREDGSNVVLVTHALTGSSRVAEWWPGIVGDGALFDPRDWCVIGINVLGGCYGSTGGIGRVTVRDIVRAQMRALDELGFERIEFVIGGSLGGMQALQWALAAPERIGHAIIVGAHDHHSAMGVALNAIQRECLALDKVRGLRTARKLAMLTYKSEALFANRHDRRPDRNDPSRFDIEGYLEHQADRFAGRMDGTTYETLTHAMDSFDVRDAWPRGVVSPKIAFVGITSDWLFRAQDVVDAAARLASRGFDASYLELRSDHGHDAFLAESDRLRELLEPVIYNAIRAAAFP